MPKTIHNLIKLPRQLPKRLRPFFWDCRFSRLDGLHDGDFVAYRILESGDWPSLLWLCRMAGEEPLKALVRQHQGRGLDLEQLRFWQVIWKLPKQEVDQWLREHSDSTWDRSAG